jgi:hypothetical protein
MGGMGEVYRARAAKLNRVPIKVLLPGVANNPERLARVSRDGGRRAIPARFTNTAAAFPNGSPS